jgi:excisionase family DNA binding protein
VTPPVLRAKEWMDVREMADELGVSKMTIYRLIHNREIPAARVGRNLRVRRAHWEQYLRFAMSA